MKSIVQFVPWSAHELKKSSSQVKPLGDPVTAGAPTLTPNSRRGSICERHGEVRGDSGEMREGCPYTCAVALTALEVSALPECSEMSLSREASRHDHMLASTPPCNSASKSEDNATILVANRYDPRVYLFGHGDITHAPGGGKYEGVCAVIILS